MDSRASTDGHEAGRLGRRAEDWAWAHLRRQGMRLRDRNYRCRLGEIDLVLEDGATIVFVEVRYRRPTGFASGAESVDQRKQRRLVLAASHYLQRHDLTDRRPVRFDVVALTLDTAGRPIIDWIADAFQA